MRSFPVLALSLALALAGCFGSGGDTDPTPTPPTATETPTDATPTPTETPTPTPTNATPTPTATPTDATPTPTATPTPEGPPAPKTVANESFDFSKNADANTIGGLPTSGTVPQPNKTFNITPADGEIYTRLHLNVSITENPPPPGLPGVGGQSGSRVGERLEVVAPNATIVASLEGQAGGVWLNQTLPAAVGMWTIRYYGNGPDTGRTTAVLVS